MRHFMKYGIRTFMKSDSAVRQVADGSLVFWCSLEVQSTAIIMKINLTETAIREIKRLRTKYGDPNMSLRLGVKPSGCSGMSYTMAFEANAKSADATFEFEGCTVLVDPLSLSIIDGLVLDFSEDLLGGGFRFNNPNAISSCGCGSSFNVGEQAAPVAAAVS